MTQSFALVTGLHWSAVVLYAAATFLAALGVFFRKEAAERWSWLVAIAGLGVHTGALLVWWRIVGHGPYMDRFEVLSANAWILCVFYLTGVRLYDRLKTIAVAVYPAVFVMIAIGLFFRPEIKMLPPTFRSIWLILHIIFYKIAFASVVITLVFSVLYLQKKRGRLAGAARIPEPEVLDLYAYRFAGFSFTFWSIGMLAGSVWAYQSWNVFWNWDPVQTWSLLTWAVFGIYLHLRRFFGWSGERAAWLYIFCFLLSLMALFFTPLIESSIHAEYFK